MVSSSVHASRMARFVEAGLYLVTSQSLSAGRTTLAVVDAVLSAGVRLIQLREKEMGTADMMALAREVRERTERVGALLLINDHVDVALAVGADGVHLGLADMPIPEARRLGRNLIIGASSHTIEEAKRAEAEGASYVNIGPVFPTKTKSWEDAFLGVEGVRLISREVGIPFTVMGGIQPEQVPELCAVGARTLAVVTAVTAAEDPGAAAGDLLALIRAGRSPYPEA